MNQDAKLSERTARLGRLWWLADAPQFIDRDLVYRLHDAVVWPDLEDVSVEAQKLEEIHTFIKGGGELEASADISAPGFLDYFLPKVKARATVKAEGGRDSLQTEQIQTVGKVIKTPERLLNELVLAYLEFFPDRLLFVEVPGGNYSNLNGSLGQATVDELLTSPPRPIVFVNVLQRSVIMPTMAEMDNGGFRPIYKILETEFLGNKSAVSYPDDDDPSADQARLNYWNALKVDFRSRRAMQVLEQSCEIGRIGWIDFRILFNDKGDTAHLHIVPAGAYYAGTFGYNFVHRAYRYGCRIVGSLKSGNDVNVLAIYET
jgi:hypothetical protein